jgi:hypothetical protein
MNLALLEDMGLFDRAFEGATAGDLVAAVDAADANAADSALARLEELLGRRKPEDGKTPACRPAGIESALKVLPDANLALISLPGAFAAREARKASMPASTSCSSRQRRHRGRDLLKARVGKGPS